MQIRLYPEIEKRLKPLRRKICDHKVPADFSLGKQVQSMTVVANKLLLYALDSAFPVIGNDNESGHCKH